MIANQILDFMNIVEKLCIVKRDNKLFNGEDESDSDHIVKLMFLVTLVHPYLKGDVNYHKMLELALIHDLVEATTGDIPLSMQRENPALVNLKKQKEQEAIEHYKSILPTPLNDKIYDLFAEYEERNTREAKVVWVLDKLEANLQANRHKDGDIHYWADCPNGHIYYEMVSGKIPMRQQKTLDELDEDILFEIEEIMLKISQDNMKKCGIKI